MCFSSCFLGGGCSLYTWRIIYMSFTFFGISLLQSNLVFCFCFSWVYNSSTSLQDFSFKLALLWLNNLWYMDLNIETLCVSCTSIQCSSLTYSSSPDSEDQSTALWNNSIVLQGTFVFEIRPLTFQIIALFFSCTLIL